MVWNIGSTKKTGLFVFVAGNFVSLSIPEASGDYEIVNKQEYLDKFFDVHQQHPFALPTVSIKDGFPDEFLVNVTRVSKNKYRVDVSRYFVPETTYREEVV